MQLIISSISPAPEITHMLARLKNVASGKEWIAGLATVGKKSASVKFDQLLPVLDRAEKASVFVVSAIQRHPSFMKTALLSRLYRRNLNRYSGASNTSGSPLDNVPRSRQSQTATRASEESLHQAVTHHKLLRIWVQT
jgi:predicted 2-oxoglutarate/Fe(II)-dependent dioxygenase YbiX